MNTFIIIAFLITALTLVLLVLPLVCNRTVIAYERKTQNIHFAKERLAELEQQLNNAAISVTDYEALKLEIENTLAEDIDIAEQNQQPETINYGSNTVLIVLLCVFIPLTASLVYLGTGNPKAIAIQEQAKQAPSAEEVNNLISSIEQRLQAQPNDATGWRVLSRTYLALGRYRQAREGFLKLISIEGETADTLVALAESSAGLVGGELAGEPSEFAERALAIAPQNPQALWLVGLSAAQQGQNEKAIARWTELLPLLSAVPQQQQELRAIIAETASQSIESTGTPDSNTSTASNQANISIRVSLSESALASSTDNDVVFVFARAQNGPPAPLAAKRLRVSDLPTTITLSDNDAMLPQFKLSLFEDITITARISKSGEPIAKKGDIQSKAIATKNNIEQTIELLISEPVE